MPSPARGMAKATILLAPVCIAALAVPASANLNDPAPEVRLITPTPMVLLGDFNVAGPPFYLLLTQAKPERGVVDVVISAYDAGPAPRLYTRSLYTAEVPLGALMLSANFRVATFDAEVPPIGRVLVQLTFGGLLGGYPANDGFVSNTWGFDYTSSSGKVSPCGDAGYSGSIGGQVITSSFCPAFATDIVEGVWYDVGVGAGI